MRSVKDFRLCEQRAGLQLNMPKTLHKKRPEELREVRGTCCARVTLTWAAKLPRNPSTKSA
eukprot:4409764-Amphidinium_carterae.1